MIKKLLAEALKLHQLHMDKPATAIAASQVTLMDLLKEMDKNINQGKGVEKTSRLRTTPPMKM